MKEGEERMALLLLLSRVRPTKRAASIRVEETELRRIDRLLFKRYSRLYKAAEIAGTGPPITIAELITPPGRFFHETFYSCIHRSTLQSIYNRYVAGKVFILTAVYSS